MLILGIDTSCDDTSAGVVEDGRLVLSNIINSQIDIHRAHGGVVPELASRQHLTNIMPVVKESLIKAGLEMRDLDGIAVTVGPGLVGSLLVGLYYAKALSYVHNIPLIAVNHLEGHILSIFMEKDVPSFPFVALTVSGGHTSLYYVSGFGQYKILGQTLDDAAGEAFDKVAKILGLGYPGGVAVEKIAINGCRDRIKFPRAYLAEGSFDFSFSGLKTAVSQYIKKWNLGQAEKGVTIEDISSSFQEAIVEVLVNKTFDASRKTGVKEMIVAGGVACNGRLRYCFQEASVREKKQTYYPRPGYCTDNGAMIAVAGYHKLLKGEIADMSIDAKSKFPITEFGSIDL